jgi:phytoene dehydrogenase-like protein
MQNFDMAVVGSGIGGSLCAALNKEKNLILFEKDSNLGGCASTFKRYGAYFNTGATTLVGYEDGHVLKNTLDKIGCTPNISKSPIALRIIQNNHIIDRTKDFEHFLEQIEQRFSNKKNSIFWEKIQQIDEKFWSLKHIYFGKYSFKHYYKTTIFIKELILLFGRDIFKSATGFIKSTLGDISKEYLDFIDAALLITIQAKSNDVSLLSLALGLAYPFHDVFYVEGGMGSIIEDIVKEIEVHKKEAIENIVQDKEQWIIESKKGTYKTKNLILNSSIYQTNKLFCDKKIKNYFEQYNFSDQSAFTLYLKIDSPDSFLHHYQFILEDKLPNCISNSFFVSFSKKEDKKLSQNGYSITISTHTKALFWKHLSKEEYEEKKIETQSFILKQFLGYFTNIKKEMITYAFSGTALTFNRYINRYNCGGKAIGFKNISQLPSTNTPFKGLYNVGDTVFAGQGWPGVALGVNVLQRQIDAIS